MYFLHIYIHKFSKKKILKTKYEDFFSGWGGFFFKNFFNSTFIIIFFPPLSPAV